MAQNGRLHDVLQRADGSPAVGATVTVYRQGATVTSNQSGVTPLAVTTADPGAIQPADVVQVNGVGPTYTVDAIGTTSVTISGFAGTLSLNLGDRLVPVNALPTLYADARSVNILSGGNPTVTDQNGEFAFWAPVSPYDILITGGGFGTRLFQDVWPAGVVLVRISASPDPNGEGWIFDARHLPSTGKIARFQVDGVDKFFINADGTISGTIAVSVPDPLHLVNGLTVDATATFNGGVGVVGGLTVDNFTGTGTFTVAAGAIAGAALANHAVTAAAVTTRGGSGSVALTTTEVARVSVSYTPAGPNSNVDIRFAANYEVQFSDVNSRRVQVALYIDGVQQFPFFSGGFNISASGSVQNFFPVSFTWIATGLSNAAHTIEVRDKYIQDHGAAGVANYRGDFVQAALIISESKK